MIYTLFVLVLLFVDSSLSALGNLSKPIVTEAPLQNESLPRNLNCCNCKNAEDSTTEKEPLDKKSFTVFRLSDSIEPIHYDIDMTFDMVSLSSKLLNEANGSVSILIKVISRTDIVILHCSLNVAIFDVQIRNATEENGDENLVKSLKQTDVGLLVIQLTTYLTPNSTYLISINDFITSYELNKETGIVVRKYKDDRETYEFILATQMQPESTRTIFPCFDEPRFKPTFRLKLTSNAQYTILNNMAEEKCLVDKSNKFKTCFFKVSPKMPIYNLAFAIVPFRYIEKFDNNNRRFRIWARRSQISKTEYALNLTVRAIGRFEQMFNVQFPLKKIDSLAIPNLNAFLGMEHFGLITYDEPVILWNEKYPLVYSKILCAVIIAHEVAHQWFGNLVTINWWSELWLNEGFATYYSHVLAAELLNDVRFYDAEKLRQTTYVRAMEDYYHTMKSTITFPVGKSAEMKFDYLSYKKGYLLVDMMKNLMGIDFQKGVTHYLKRNLYGSVKALNLWDSLNRYSKVKLESIMNDWLDKFSYPIVKITNTEKNVIKLQQSVYLNMTDIKEISNYSDYVVQSWNIPLYVVYGNSSFQSVEYKYLLGKSEKKLKLEGFDPSKHWIMLNLNMKSLFTTDFNENVFRKLKSQFLENYKSFSPVDRGQIMLDYYDLSKKYSRNNLIELLKLIEYIKDEIDPIPLKTVVTILDKLNGLIEYRWYYLSWRKYLANVLRTPLQRLVREFENNVTKTEIEYMRYRIMLITFACKLKFDLCSNFTEPIFKRWQNKKLLQTDYDLLHIALCKFVQSDNTGQNWLYLYKTKDFDSWDYITVKYYAMGCSSVPWVVEKNIDVAYNVLSNSNYRSNYPHISEITDDVLLSDDLLGTTPLRNILLFSAIYNSPDMKIALLRYPRNVHGLIYNALIYPPHFLLPESLVEHAIPTLSHYNFIISHSASKKYRVMPIILKDAKMNIEWINGNRNISDYLMKTG